jgi:DNA-binding transcriptional regulator YbjK
MAANKGRRNRMSAAVTLQDRLLSLIGEALETAKVARKHRKPLNGCNYYADKMAELRAAATNIFSKLSVKSVGDTSVLAELINRCSPRTCQLRNELKQRGNFDSRS